jgi:rod shape-determining protein MreC
MRKIRFALGAVALAAVFHFVPFFDPAEAQLTRGFLDIGYGIRNGALAVSADAEQIFAAGRVQKENAALSAQVVALNEKVAAVAPLTAENDTLKGLLNFRTRTGLELVACEIVGGDPDTSARALVIDCGAESKVARGQAVITGDGTLVGSVERVANGRSTVLPRPIRGARFPNIPNRTAWRAASAAWSLR